MVSGITVVGLTGNIACGKSTVAGELRERGFPVVDADQLAREVVAPGSSGLAEIVRTFGPEVLGADGELDRQRVAALVFSDPGARRKLEQITHPRIAQLGAQRLSELAQSGVRLAFYEAALIVENNLQRALHALIVVVADEGLQIQRLRDRRGLDEHQARARIAAQMPQDEKRKAADFVIENNGTLAELRRSVDEVVAAIEARFSIARGE